MSAINSLADTQHIAHMFASRAEKGDVLALSGEVGAGKTTFAQFFIASLLAKTEPITSPTFTLIQRYETKGGFSLLHADLYRLKHASELLELGLEEAFDTHLCVVEWPEIASAILPKNTLHITFVHAADNSREIRWHSADSKWKEVI